MSRSQGHEDFCWVDVAGEVVHVSTFAHLQRYLRPSATCPVCDQPVILHLGRKRAHHYQHHPAAARACPLASGESALHYNAKHYLCHQLAGARELIIAEPCVDSDAEVPDASLCPGRRVVVWARDWDDVAVERGVQSTRPDVLLLTAGQPVAAIEVVVSHAVDEVKEQTLQSLGIPWLEIDARCALDWRSPEALPYLRLRPARNPWRCEYHEKKYREDTAARARIEEAIRQVQADRAAWAQVRLEQKELATQLTAKREADERERRTRTRTVRVRAVDCCYRNGKRTRHVFRVNAWIPAGASRADTVWLSCDSFSSVHISDPNPSRKITLAHLNQRLIEWLEDLRKHDRLVAIEAPAGWMRPEAHPADRLMDLTAYPPRYRLDPDTGTWCLLR